MYPEDFEFENKRYIQIKNKTTSRFETQMVVERLEPETFTKLINEKEINLFGNKLSQEDLALIRQQIQSELVLPKTIITPKTHTKFIGRENHLKLLKKYLINENQVVMIEGSGKKALTLEFAHQFHNESKENNFVYCFEYQKLTESLINFASKIKQIDSNGKNGTPLIRKIYKCFQEQLNADKNILFIVFGLKKEENEIKDWIQDVPKNILVIFVIKQMIRLNQIDVNNVYRIRLGQLSDKEAIEYIRLYSSHENSNLGDDFLTEILTLNGDCKSISGINEIIKNLNSYTDVVEMHKSVQKISKKLEDPTLYNGKYKIKAQVGSGSFGTVYKIENVQDREM